MSYKHFTKFLFLYVILILFNTISATSQYQAFSWGDNTYGQLGIGKSHWFPLQVGSDTNWRSFSGGDNHIVAIKTDGTLWAWGWNNVGQLGTGFEETNDPLQIGSDTNWRFISCGSAYTLAIKSNGTLWGWGSNSFGSIGDSSTTQRARPVQIGTDTNWLKVFCGKWHTFAIKNDGSLWAWGHNTSGQLGDSTQTDKLVPTRIGMEFNWEKIACGNDYTLAIKSDSSLWAWGSNGFGQLGDSTLITKIIPIRIDTLNKWKDVSCYINTRNVNGSFGITYDGKLWGWGYNITGRLGLGDSTNRIIPTRIGNDSTWLNISCCGEHCIAQKSDTTYWGWGYNEYGQLGDSTTTDKIIPNLISRNNDWKLISCIGNYTLFLKNDGTIWACGGDESSLLGLSQKQIYEPTLFDTLFSIDCISNGSMRDHNFIISPYLKAWGKNYYGQLGDSTNNSKSSVLVSDSNNIYKMIASGQNHTLAVKNNGTLWAWGLNDSYQLGDGTKKNRINPVQIGTDTNWAAVSCGDFHSIALKKDGSLWAWGRNIYGNLGDGTTSTRISPRRIGSSTDWKTVVCGAEHTLALKNNSTLWAWGWNTSGQCGDGTTTNKTSPIQIGTDTNWISISAGMYHSIGLKSNGIVYGWGGNSDGQLGDGTYSRKTTPSKIIWDSNFVKISCGGYHTLAIKNNGTLYAWGDNDYKQLAKESHGGSGSPLLISYSTNWKQISAGEVHTIALAEKNKAIAFDGTNDYASTNINASNTEMPVTTWEAWVYPQRVNHSSRQSILSIDDGGYDREVYIEQNTNQFAIHVGSYNIFIGPEVDLNKWQHIAVTWGTDFIRFYKNGKEYLYRFIPITTTTTNNLNIGRNPSGNEYYQGYIDDIRIWKAARNSKDIINYMNNEFADFSQDTNLVAHFKCNEISGDTLFSVNREKFSVLRNEASRIDQTKECYYIEYPGLYFPANNSTNIPTNCLFTWSNWSSSFNKYYLVIGLDSNLQRQIAFFELDASNGSQFKIPEGYLFCNHDFYWSIFCSNDDMISQLAIIRKFTTSNCNDEKAPMILDNWNTSTWPLNAYYPLAEGGVNGRVGNACGPTMRTRVKHYWEHPYNGRGSLDWSDVSGYRWVADFENTYYDWDKMTNTITGTTTEDLYRWPATLMHHSMVAWYDYGGSGRNLYDIAEYEHSVFRYDSSCKVYQRWHYSKDEWIKIIKNELNEGRPVMIMARTSESPLPWESGNFDGHYYIIDGYNSQNKFHTAYGFGGMNDYYDIDSLGNYKACQEALINFKPDFREIVPRVISPTDSSLSDRYNEIVLYWKDVLYSDNYQLRVSNKTDFSTNLVNINSLTSSNYTLDIETLETWHALGYDTLYWKVRATNSRDTTKWSIARCFYITDCNLSSPTLISIENNATGINLNPVLSWNAVEQATQYRVQVSTNSQFNSIVYDTVTSNEDVALFNLDNTSNYYWRVLAICASDTSEWSDVWTFRTESFCQWISQTSGTTTQIWRTELLNSNIGWVSGSGGLIKMTTDGGANWTSQTSGSNQRLAGLSIIDENNLFVAGTSGTIKKTTNGGANWSGNALDTTYIFWGIDFINQNLGLAVGLHPTSYAGRILRTTNSGANWEVVNTNGNALYDAVLINFTTGWVSGNYGRISKTTDGGTTWINQSSTTINNLWGIFFINENNGWAVGENGAIVHTTNGGSNWATQTSGTTRHLRRIHFEDTNNGWAVGDTGTILKTIDGGVNWIPMESSTTSDLWGLCFENVNLGWSSGFNGTILKYECEEDTTIETPGLISPNNNANEVSLTPTFSWFSVNSATSYTLQVSTSSSFTENIVNTVMTSTPYTATSNLSYNTTYYWRVKASNDETESDWSEIWQFTTQEQDGYTLSGTVTYANTAQTPMNNCIVIARDENDNELGRDTTDAEGNYSIENLDSGVVRIEVVTNKSHGGVNITDVLQLRQRIGNIINFDALQEEAADINNTGTINISDVLPMRQKIAGISAPNWLITNYVYNPIEVVITDSDVEFNIEALCGGDVNGSFTPGNE